MEKKEPVPIKFQPDKTLVKLFAKVVVTAKQFPGVVESRSYGTPAIKVKERLIARLRSEAEGGLALRCNVIKREMLLMSAPETFYITDHYENSSYILINLGTANWNAMPDIIERAWLLIASPKLIKEYEMR